MKRNKLLSLLLALCMVLSLLPAVASAETTEVVDVLTASEFAATSTNYTDFSGVKFLSDAVYAGNSAKTTDGAIQLRSKSNSGIVTTASGGKVKTIEVTWQSGTSSSRVLEVFGKNTAYNSASDLYSSSADTKGVSLGTAEYNGDSGEVDTITVTGDYTYIGFRSESGALYLTEVEITWEQEGGEPTETYTVTFESGIEGVDSIIYNEVSANYTLPDGTIFEAPEGKEFDQWVVKGTETKYDAGELVTLEGDTTFVATWKDLPKDRTYTLVTSDADLIAGKTYIIVGVNESNYYAFANQTTNNRSAVQITVNENKATVGGELIATSEGDTGKVFELTLGGNADDGWTFFDSLKNGYLYAASSSKNYLKTQTTNDNNGKFDLTFDTTGTIKAVAKGTYTHNTLYFNYNNGTPIFSCYLNAQQPVYLYKLEEGSEPEVKPTFAKKNLVLSGEIGVNFYMDLPEIEGVNYEESYMTFEISGKGTTTEQDNFDATDKNQTGEYFGFTCYVNSIQMADTITATFHYGDGKTVSETYSVKQYVVDFDAYNDNPENVSFDNETITLVHTLADYGHYAQPFLATHNGWTIGTDYAAQDKFYATEYNYKYTDEGLVGKNFTKEINGEDISAITYSLALDSATEIRVFIKPAEGYTGEITVAVDGGEPFTPELVSGRYLVKISSISAHQLSDMHRIVITTDNGGATVSVSALSYVYSMLKNYPTDTNAVNAMSAFYAYSLAADAYTAAQ